MAGTSPAMTTEKARLERQRLDLLDLRQGLHPGQQIRRHRTVDLDQRDGIGAGRDGESGLEMTGIIS